MSVLDWEDSGFLMKFEDCSKHFNNMTIMENKGFFSKPNPEGHAELCGLPSDSKWNK